jgi:hypothetical protein
MAAPTSDAADPWEVVTYEAWMLFGLCRILEGETFNVNPDVAKNAVVESVCLHTRIFVDILLSKDSGKGDDIRLNQLLPGFQHSAVDQLRAAHGDGKPDQPPVPWPCWTLNKMIAHPTLKRGNSHDYTDVIKKLLPFIEEVWREIESYHRLSVSQVAKPTGGLDPRFCAKTSS